MRWIDLIGLAGWGLLVAGVLVAFSTSAQRSTWFLLVVGGAMWAVGFVSIVGWLLMRLMPQERARKAPKK